MASAATGTAVFFKSYVPSECFFLVDPGPMIAKASRDLYDNGLSCGTSCRVRCIGPAGQGASYPCHNGEIAIQIVDPCPGCEQKQLNLSQTAYSLIANPDAGKIQIEYNCGISEPQNFQKPATPIPICQE